MQTAKQFMSNIGIYTSPITGLETYLKDDFEQALIKFAKLHVEAALAHRDRLYEIYYAEEFKFTDSNKEFIKKSYPLTNIK